MEKQFKKIDSLIYHHDCAGKTNYKELKKNCPFYWLFSYNSLGGNPTNYEFHKLSTFKKKRYTNPLWVYYSAVKKQSVLTGGAMQLFYTKKIAMMMIMLIENQQFLVINLFSLLQPYKN